jgi:pyruvate/2-oxoglutarate dehydrogenase complex dihydrolipoamide acyltransferase (E2) component
LNQNPERENGQPSGAKRGGYRIEPFVMERQMVAAVGSEARRQNNIHAMIEVDVHKARGLIQQHKARTGESLSFTAFTVTCLGQALAHYPSFNAFRKGRRLIVLDDVTISVQVEREIHGVRTPEPLGIREAQRKTYRQIHDEIREAQEHAPDEFGGLSGAGWVRFIPSSLFRVFIRLAARSIRMMQQYGAVGVTAVGMFGPRDQAGWLLPLVGGASVAVAIGGIVQRPVLRNGELENHEHLCLTVTFNHDIVDGAPAARFLKTFSEYLKNADPLLSAINEQDQGSA